MTTSTEIVEALTADEARKYLAAVLDSLYSTSGVIDIDKEWSADTLQEIAFQLEGLVQ